MRCFEVDKVVEECSHADVEGGLSDRAVCAGVFRRGCRFVELSNWQGRLDAGMNEGSRFPSLD